MRLFSEVISLATSQERELVDVTDQARQLDLSTWQNIFFCELDGPRRRRTIAVTIIGT